MLNITLANRQSDLILSQTYAVVAQSLERDVSMASDADHSEQAHSAFAAKRNDRVRWAVLPAHMSEDCKHIHSFLSRIDVEMC